MLEHCIDVKIVELHVGMSHSCEKHGITLGALSTNLCIVWIDLCLKHVHSSGAVWYTIDIQYYKLDMTAHFISNIKPMLPILFTTFHFEHGM
uniref:Uncharacterized protein n=1 Tax=Manihot esculenta TaxID=3983 RepID=A0A2C9VX45_MANES